MPQHNLPETLDVTASTATPITPQTPAAQATQATPVAQSATPAPIPRAELSLSDFDYDLPTELIAQTPAQERRQSRLLRVDTQGQSHDHGFEALLDYLRPGDVLVFNNTKVIKARLLGHKATGGKVEALVERVLDPQCALAHLRASNAPPVGSQVYFAEGVIRAKVVGRQDGLTALQFEDDVLSLLEQHGQLPLPPYITHQPTTEDEQRYQTVYATQPGAVAAPTAGLHFDEAMLAALTQAGIQRCDVTLHVGAGTFQPVRTSRLAEHVMHNERYEVSASTVATIEAAKAAGGRVIAVGTTSVRALESAAAQHPQGKLTPQQGDTRLFITPGYDFRVVDGLLTNFHLPQSTLLMLVAALMGLDTMKASYQHAIKAGYRFFSYGDAMLIEPRDKN